MALLRRASAAVLLLVAMGSLAAAAEGDAVGWVIQANPRVEGERGDKKWELRQFPDKPYDVFEKMAISTFTGAGARIIIDIDLTARKGIVILGPETHIELTERSLTQARSLKKLSWLVKLGQFRLALQPRDPNALPGEGECLIYTAAGDLIQLSGTDVAVEVGQDSTLTVWVIEGEVVVTAAAGGKKRIPAGYGTRVQPGHEPEPPMRFVIDGPGPGLPPRHEERIFPDPPRLDLRRLRLDLPQ